ncbi:MAG TPA: potassium channel protein [Gemmataceae bacterium]|nr:potassium channel protein [Gemmataceae bacterium]
MPPRRFLILILLPVALMAIGTAGYRLIEGPTWSILDALYMTATTLTTVGFGEIHPLSPAGRVFTIVLCLTGVFALFFAAGEIIRTMLSGEIQKTLGRHRMERNLAALSGHYIVCGHGRMGQLVCQEFTAHKLPFVVIENGEERIEALRQSGLLYVHGDATSDETLRLAGVERAQALITVVASDADNLYITLSARLLNEKLLIVARAEGREADAKLRRVGANHVVSPYVIGGFRIAQAVIRPAVVDFIELATRTDHLEMQIEEIELAAGSPLVGHTLGEQRFHQQLGVIVMAIKMPKGAMVANPTGETILEGGSTLIALGHRDQLDKLERLAAAARDGQKRP